MTRPFRLLFAVLILASFPLLSRSEEPPKGVAALQVPEGFVVEEAAGPDLVPYPMCGALDERGRLFITESSGLDVSGREMAQDPQCRIRCLVDEDGDGQYDSSTIFADDLSLPMGVLWYEGSLYVASPPHFHRFADSDEDGVADVSEILLTGWNVLNTASLHGPFLGPDGWLYLTHGRHGYKIETQEGTTLEGQAARLWRCRPDGSSLERFCGGGFDNPVELAFDPAGEVLGTMTYFTDPRNGQRDALNHWIEGGVYPKVDSVLEEFTRTGPLLPSITHFSRIAPAGFMRMRGTTFGPEYRGNYFSAQFNPHRIQRHVITRRGSTFASVDSDFLTSSDPDFFPTDVLEDADGSLIVLNTGAWYVDACPLSRVAKPEIKGGIYRIRPKDAPPLEDPRGEIIAWKDLSAGESAGLFKDHRPWVQDRAFERVLSQGDEAIDELFGLAVSEATEEVRCRAVWALHQIADRLESPGPSDRARLKIREVLATGKGLERVAAAQAMGRASDKESREELERAVGESNPPLQLAAATALGRIGDKASAAALLEAASGNHDAHLNHALVYASIGIADVSSLREGLNHPSPWVRRASLVALDQIGGEALRQEDLEPFFDGTLEGPRFSAFDTALMEEVREIALWVVSHHPEWSGVVLESVAKQIRGEEWGPARESSLREALLAFASEPRAQDLMASLLRDESVEDGRKVFLIATLSQVGLADLPASWLEALSLILTQGAVEARWEAVDLLRTREISSLDEKLAAIAEDVSLPTGLRIAATDVLLSRTPQLSETQYHLLLSALGEEVDPTLRLAAATALGKARLSHERLVEVAEGPLAEADALSLPSLVKAFQGHADEQVGTALTEALSGSSISAQILGEENLRTLLASYPDSVREAAQPMFANLEKEKELRVARLQELEPLLSGGDVGRGRQVFFGTKTACATCHAIGEDGGDLGPDLTAIGKIRNGRDILEAIVFPSASLVPGYESVRIETFEETLNGVLGEQSPDAVILKPAADAVLRVPREDIVSMIPSKVSLMPEGLDTGITQEELLDLLAFLQAQNGNQWLRPE